MCILIFYLFFFFFTEKNCLHYLLTEFKYSCFEICGLWSVGGPRIAKQQKRNSEWKWECLQISLGKEAWMGGEQWLISASLTDWMTGLPQTTGICFNPPLFFPFLFLFFFSPFVLAHIRRAWCFWACWLKKVLEEETPVLSWWLCSVAGFSMDMM